jgi:hypothetical protein
MRYFLLCGLLAIAPLTASAQDKQLLWGDTHLHTSYSFDAYTNSNFTADPNTAYRYARGMPVIHPYHRARVQIETPLDFLVVSDHAEFLGVIREIHQVGVDTSELGPWDSLKAELAGWYLNRVLDQGDALEYFRGILPPPMPVREAAKSVQLGGNADALPEMHTTSIDAWRSIATIADAYNEPGEFTAIIGWEWSSIPGGSNLHRVVMTDGDAASAERYYPYSLLDSQYPEDLWAWLESTSEQVGANFLSIPHNSNISKGFMFDDTRLRGSAFDADYIAMRRKWEPIAEITQIKGDSETHPELSPDDEFANFEEFPYYLQGTYSPYKVAPGDYVRAALKRGLSLEQEFGQNPYQLGVIGSTDAHTGLSSAEEDNFWGKLATDSTPESKNTHWGGDDPSPSGWAMSASGLAAVWAEENTREAILAAMRRREVYGTSGPRIGLRFFGGADLAGADLMAADIYQQATSRGVPMGGELGAMASSPTFLVIAARDPAGANLDRIQIVKGWLDNNGQEQEKVFDVAWSDDRQPGPDGKVRAVGNTVDTNTGHYDNSIGATQLSVAWQDPQFDARQSAFYYVRVLQIPTPRHSLYDAIALGEKHAGDHPDTIQERAYSSPIWYKP